VHIEDRTEILANLKLGRDALVAALGDVSEEVARRKPDPAKWSILECMEHVAVAEEYLFGQVSNATRSEIPMINIARESAIVERGADRTRRVESPDVAKPRNRFASVKSALDHFQATREKTIQCVENYLDDPRAMIGHHPTLGSVNTCEILLLMAVHPLRHAEQIREILESLKG
jgi:hypothetical protein